MPISPLITFKAGECLIDTSSKPYKVTPVEDPGYVYLYPEDNDLVHFCWRRRGQSLEDPKLDLVMVPTDGQFLPYEYETTQQSSSKTNGRIFVLKFASSSQRHLFWMQSKPQGRDGDPSYFSPRDRKIGDLVHRLLQGEEVNVAGELAAVRNTDDRRDDGDDDETMEDADAHSGHSGSRDRRAGGSGGAGADATGGDVREEGEGPREGGADGARAASSATQDAQAAVRNFLESFRAQGGLAQQQQQEHGDKPYPHLHHLLPTSTTVPLADTLSVEQVDRLLTLLPSTVIMQATPGYDGKTEPTEEQLTAALASVPLERKREMLKKVLRSPQFHQALGGLTMALRDGGLPSIAEALGVAVDKGGYMRPGMPLGGGYAVEAFINGVKKSVQEKDGNHTRE